MNRLDIDVLDIDVMKSPTHFLLWKLRTVVEVTQAEVFGEHKKAEPLS